MRRHQARTRSGRPPPFAAGWLAALLIGILATPACTCGRPAGSAGTNEGYGRGTTTGPTGVSIPLGGPGRLGYLALTDDGGFVAAETPLEESKPTLVHLFDPAGRPRGSVTVQRAVVRLSRDGKVLGTASAADRVLALWDAHDGKPIRRWTASRTLRGLAFSGDGTQIADVDEGGAVRIYQIASGRRIARLFDGEVESPSLDWSADGTTLVLGRTFSQRVWDLATSTAERAENADAGDAPRVSSDGRFVASIRANAGGVALTDRRSRRTTTAADGAFSVFSADGKRLAAETRSHAITVLDLATGSRVSELKGACRKITSASFSPDGAKILASSEDGSARLWDVASGRELAGWHLPPDCALSFNPQIDAVAFSDDGKTILLGFYEKTIERVDLGPELASAPAAKAAPAPAVVPPAPARRVPSFGDVVATLDGFSDCKFSPTSTEVDWTLAVAAGDGSARLFHGSGAEEPEERAALGAPGNQPATRVAWSGDGKLLAVGDHGGRVQFVDTASGKVLATTAMAAPPGPTTPGPAPLTEISALAISPDGALIAAGGRGTRIRVWKPDGALAHDLEGHTVFPGRDTDLTSITSIVLAPGGNTMFSASNDFYNASHGDLRRWDLTTGRHEQLGDVAYLAALSLSNDGALLASGEQKRIVVRDARTNQIRHTLSGHTGKVKATAFLPDGRTLASVDEETPAVILWDLASGRELARLADDDQRCQDAWLSVSPDSKLVAASFQCAGGHLRVFSIAGRPRPGPETSRTPAAVPDR